MHFSADNGIGQIRVLSPEVGEPNRDIVYHHLHSNNPACFANYHLQLL